MRARPLRPTHDRTAHGRGRPRRLGGSARRDRNSGRLDETAESFERTVAAIDAVPPGSSISNSSASAASAPPGPFTTSAGSMESIAGSDACPS